MMKVYTFILFMVLSTWSELPKFKDATGIKANNTAISIKNSSPTIADWDGDGLKDLIVGQFSSGKIHFFKNVGSESEPELIESSFLQANASDITLSYG